jgi:phasin family protein
MSVFEPEQLFASNKVNAATLFALTNQAFEGFHRLVELNLQTVRSALVESEAHWQELLSMSGKSPEVFLTWQAGLMQPAAGKALAYSRQLYGIASSTQAELTKVVQAQSEHHNRANRTLVDNVVSNVPAGTEVATAMLKSAFSTASNAYETMRIAADHAIELAKGNFAATAADVTKIGQQAAAQVARATKR